MSFILNGRFKGGVVVLDDPADIPEGAAVRVEVLSTNNESDLIDQQGLTLGEKMLLYASKLTDLPVDLALNHDHYLHGNDKK